MTIGLAPMEGVVDPLVRKVLTSLPGIDFCTTEFIRVTDRIHPPRTFYKYAPELAQESKTDSGVPVLVQLLGGKPEWMAENAKVAKRLGACGIDLNFGCPAKKVNSHDGGAVLLKSPDRLYKTITAVREAVEDKIPVSAKVRLGCDDKSKYLEISRACSEARASWMTVHARTKLEGYKPPAHWHLIKEMKDVSDIKVIANGDIFNEEDARNCMLESQCSDIMIGRGLMIDPFLASKIKRLTTNKEINYISLILKYLNQSKFIYGEERSVRRAKQWLRMISEKKQGQNTLFEQIKTFKKLPPVLEVLNSAEKMF